MRFMNLKKQKKGITLIALVITIIVLLILTAVSIATLTGDNGILTKAQTAKTETEKASEEEQIKLEKFGKMLQNMENSFHHILHGYLCQNKKTR